MSKINLFYRFLIAATTVCSFTACDFLDIVPDENATEKDTYSDKDKAEKYLYSCYGFLPQCNIAQNSLDLLTGDEVVSSFEHETFASFPKGNFTASNPVISYWNWFFQGIRQTYMFLDAIDKTPGLDDAMRTDYKAQAKFLIGYYHYLLARCYGPIILVNETPDFEASVKDYAHRRPYDECVEWICNKLDEAAANLPASRPQVQYGLATNVAAKAIKAKMLLYAASPLFNEQAPTLFGNMKDPDDGTPLMPAAYDPNKWVKARDAMKEAIDLAEANGYHLYTKQDRYIGDASKNPYPVAGPERCMRLLSLDYQEVNPEVLLAETRGEGWYGVQNKSMPFNNSGSAWNGICPTWAMLNRFYTKNGLPWDEDPAYKNNDKVQVVTIDAAHEDEGKVGEQTIAFNLDREPRFYAWVAFQGGYYELQNDPTNPAYTMSNGQKNTSDSRLVCDFLLGGNCSRGTVSQRRPGNYSPGGYLNKKFVSPNTVVASSGGGSREYAPFPVIRLADLYLGYAEACVETGDLQTAKTYLNKVRVRAGIPTVETSWAPTGIALNQAKLRQIVRQERMAEFYLECQNFWDMRRWMLAEQYFNVKAKGLNIDATTMPQFATLKDIQFERKFEAPTQYLLPIPIDDINKNPHLVNNPGYTGDHRK